MTKLLFEAGILDFYSIPDALSAETLSRTFTHNNETEISTCPHFENKKTIADGFNVKPKCSCVTHIMFNI